MNLKTTLAGLVVAAAAAGATAAHAEVVTFQFTGTVTYSTYLAPVGTPITGTFIYDTHALPVWEKKFGTTAQTGFSAYRMTPPFTITAQVNGHTLTAEQFCVDVSNNMGGNTEDMADIYGAEMTLDGTRFASGSFGMRLASGPGNDKVWSNTRLPSSFDVSRFDSMNYGWVQMDGSQTGTLLQFTVDSITVIDSQR